MPGQQGEVEAPGCPAGGVRRAGVGETKGFRGTLAPKPSSAPQGLASRGAFPKSHAGVPAPLREGCGIPAQPRRVRAGPRR